jgi:hypothetical protein
MLLDGPESAGPVEGVDDPPLTDCGTACVTSMSAGSKRMVCMATCF